MSSNFCSRCGGTGAYHFTVPPKPAPPPIERYLRRSLTIASGARFDAGIEHRQGDDTAALSAHLREWADLAGTEHPNDLAALGNAWACYAIVNYPDRYWFCEVWGPDDEAAFYQVIQPPPGGTGMRR